MSSTEVRLSVIIGKCCASLFFLGWIIPDIAGIAMSGGRIFRLGNIADVDGGFGRGSRAVRVDAGARRKALRRRFESASKDWERH